MIMRNYLDAELPFLWIFKWTSAYFHFQLIFWSLYGRWWSKRVSYFSNWNWSSCPTCNSRQISAYFCHVCMKVALNKSTFWTENVALSAVHSVRMLNYYYPLYSITSNDFQSDISLPEGPYIRPKTTNVHIKRTKTIL